MGFLYWELAREKGLIKPDATLFHGDAHYDDCPFVLENNTEYIDINGLENIKAFTDEFVNIDTFIWPAFGRKTIRSIVYVSDFSFQSPFEEWS
jgi:hypothetical protein